METLKQVGWGILQTICDPAADHIAGPGCHMEADCWTFAGATLLGHELHSSLLRTQCV